MSEELTLFKPGNVVKGSGLAREAVVVQHWKEEPQQVQVITQNGLAEVPTEGLELVAEHIQERAAQIVQQKDAAMEAFKEEVRDKAMDAADSHGWCEEVRGILNELGIKTKIPRVRAVLHLTVEVDAELLEGSSGLEKLDMNRGTNKDWWAQTLKFSDDGKDLQFQDDEDVNMDRVEVRLVTAEVVEVHDNSYLEGED